jgi:protein-disulfide isomerase
MRVHAGLFVLFVAAAATVGCPKATPAPGAAPSAGASEVVATLDGAPITQAEVDERAKERLMRVRQDEYEARREALDQLVGQKLLEKEAKSRGISVEQLLKDEVDRQIPAATPEMVNQVYQQNRAAFGNKPRDQVDAEIVRALAERARGAYGQAFTNKLREKATLSVALEPPRVAVVVPSEAPSLGPSRAKVTIVAFSDFQCPYCQRAQNVIDQVMKSYGGKVQLVHRDFPLDGHAQAFVAARAARCAGEQGRFWEYHHSLMVVRGDMSEADLRQRALGLKLDLTPFSSCLGSDRHDAAIRDGLEAGLKLGVNSTPTFFVNGQMIVGAKPFETFKDAIETELKRAS